MRLRILPASREAFTVPVCGEAGRPAGGSLSGTSPTVADWQARPRAEFEIPPAYGRQSAEVGNLTAIVVVLRLGAHKALNAQNAKAVFNRGEGIAKLLGKLTLADRNALVIVRSGYVPQDLFFETGLTRGVCSSRRNYAF